MIASVTRSQVLSFRVRAQQLDRDALELNDAAILDIGVQDTGPDGAGWALSNPRCRRVRSVRPRAGQGLDDSRRTACLPP